MDRGVFRHILTALAVLAIGPIAGAIAGDIRSPGGASGATALTSESPARGGLLLLIALTMVGATGTLAAKLYGARQGLLCAGLVAAWVAWRQGTVESVLVNARSGGPMAALATEGLLVGAAAVTIAWLVFRVTREPPAVRSEASSPRMECAGEAVSIAFAASLAAAGAIIGAYLVGVEELKGQLVFAAFVGSVFAGAGARFVRPETTLAGTSTIGAFAGIAVVGVAGPVWAMLMHGDGMVGAAFAGAIPRVAGVGPTEWLAGALLGVPVGDAWAGAMFQPRHPEPT